MLKKILLTISIIVSIIILLQTKPLKSYYTEKDSDVYYYKDPTGIEVPIPFGFVVSNEENKVADGLVIIDNSGTETHGSEFVWVPCDEFEPIYYGIQTLAKKNYNTNFVDKKEYKDIKKSVEKYKGFYIGRYEASKSGKFVDGIQIAVSVKNATPWNEIVYAADSNDIYGNSYGINKVAKHAYLNNKYVNSALVYPEHFDNVINWFLSFDDLKNEANMKITKDDLLDDSGKIGNYSTSIANTGSSNVYCIKNICDLAGNVQEVTPESYRGNYHIMRGGNSKRASAMISRVNIDSFTVGFRVGFRMVLVI